MLDYTRMTVQQLIPLGDEDSQAAMEPFRSERGGKVVRMYRGRNRGPNDEGLSTFVMQMDGVKLRIMLGKAGRKIFRFFSKFSGRRPGCWILRHGLLRPVSEKRMPGKREPAEHQPHHCRAIDRNIPSRARVPALPESASPGNFKCIGAVPEMQNYWTQEPMPRKSITLDPRIDRSGCGFHATKFGEEPIFMPDEVTDQWIEKCRVGLLAILAFHAKQGRSLPVIARRLQEQETPLEIESERVADEDAGSKPKRSQTQVTVGQTSG